MVFHELVLFDIDIMKECESFKRLSRKIANLNGTGMFCVRSLEIEDYDKNYIKLLSELTVTGSISKAVFEDKFRSMKACPDTYHILVIEDCNKKQLIGTITLFVEHKFIRQASKRGRIEDVVVSKEFRSFGLGLLMVDAMKELADKIGCYKLTLECNDNIVKFYEKSGFIKEENQNFMSIRF